MGKYVDSYVVNSLLSYVKIVFQGGLVVPWPLLQCVYVTERERETERLKNKI